MNHLKPSKTPRRNDPCYCGSGKKYKRCHGAGTVSSVDAAYAKLRRLDDESTERSASGILAPGHIVLARVVEMDGICFFMGVPGQVILPLSMEHVLELR